jgi:hypothetical protein
MKNITKFFAIALVILGFTATSFAQSTASANAAAKILAGIGLTKTVDLNFGTMTSPSAATTVTLSPTGVRTDGGNINLLTTAPIAAAASYNVTGDLNANYAITLPASTTIISGGNSMTVNTFTSSKAGNVSVLSGTGTDTFTVGATLILGNAQPAGDYTGTYNVTVAYN